MSTHALVNGRLVAASTLTNGSAGDCPVCGEGVYVKAADSQYVSVHFCHYSGEGHSEESNDHHMIKWAIANALTDVGIDARTEFTFGDRRADVMVFRDGSPRFAIEVQLAYQPKERLIARHESYIGADVSCAWLGKQDAEALLAHIESSGSFWAWADERVVFEAAKLERIKNEVEEKKRQAEQWEADRPERERIERERIECSRLKAEQWEAGRPERERIARERAERAARRADLDKQAKKFSSQFTGQTKSSVFVEITQAANLKEREKLRPWMTITDLREEFMMPTINRVRCTLLPFVAECALAAAERPTLEHVLAAAARLRQSKSPIADACTPSYIRWAWGTVDEDDIVVRWVRLHGSVSA